MLPLDESLRNLPKLQVAGRFLENAFELLKEEAKNRDSRELQRTIDHVEIALMLNNKNRTIRGEIKPYSTHVSADQVLGVPSAKK